MAKTRALAPYRSPVVVVSPPRRLSRGRSRGLSRRGRARGFRRGKGSGITTTTATTVGIGGAVVGWMGAKGYLSKLPAIGGSRMTTLGLLGLAAIKFGRNKYLKAAGLAAVATAAFDVGRTQGGGAALAGYDVEGDDDGI